MIKQDLASVLDSLFKKTVKKNGFRCILNFYFNRIFEFSSWIVSPLDGG
jgi:hypothetical protein